MRVEGLLFKVSVSGLGLVGGPHGKTDLQLCLQANYPPTLGGVLDGFSNGKVKILETRGRGGGGGAGGVAGVSRARFPPDPHICGSRFSRLPPLRQETFHDEKPSLGFLRKGPKPLWARPPSPWTPAQGACGSKPSTLSFQAQPSACDFRSPGHPKRSAGRPA